MVPKSEGRESSVQESSGGEDILEERRATSKSAEGTGRLPKLEVTKRVTNFARLQESEDWEQSPLRCPDKKSVNYMIELEAGSGVYYQGCAQKWSASEVEFHVALERPPNSVNLWLRLTSSRIWRGPMSQKAWSYLGKGAWKPRAKAKLSKGKAKLKSKKRSTTEDTGDGDEAAVTTTTAQSDDVVGAAALDDGTPSPHAVKGSNAVSPEADGKHSFRSLPGAARASGGIVVKTELEEAKGSEEEKKPNLYVQWLTRHLQLLGHQGQLNTCPGGNPESGSLSGAIWQSSSHQDGVKGGGTSSSSGSAGRGQNVSHNSSVPKKSKLQSSQRQVKTKISSEPEDSSRKSASPATPHKQGDVERVCQRSSSADGPPISGGAPGAENGGFKAGGCRRYTSAKPPPAEASAEASGVGRSARKHLPAVHSPQKKHSNQDNDAGLPKMREERGFSGLPTKNGSHPGLLGAKEANASAPRKQQATAHSSHKHFASQASPDSQKALPALVETDPFAEPGFKRQRAM